MSKSYGSLFPPMNNKNNCDLQYERTSRIRELQSCQNIQYLSRVTIYIYSNTLHHATINHNALPSKYVWCVLNSKVAFL